MNLSVHVPLHTVGEKIYAFSFRVETTVFSYWSMIKKFGDRYITCSSFVKLWRWHWIRSRLFLFFFSDLLTSFNLDTWLYYFNKIIVSQYEVFYFIQISMRVFLIHVHNTSVYVSVKQTSACISCQIMSPGYNQYLIGKRVCWLLIIRYMYGFLRLCTEVFPTQWVFCYGTRKLQFKEEKQLELRRTRHNCEPRHTISSKPAQRATVKTVRKYNTKLAQSTHRTEKLRTKNNDLIKKLAEHNNITRFFD